MFMHELTQVCSVFETPLNLDVGETEGDAEDKMIQRGNPSKEKLKEEEEAKLSSDLRPEWQT